jgi:hypothetical protein
MMAVSSAANNPKDVTHPWGGFFITNLRQKSA